jgi:hypothetical protein
MTENTLHSNAVLRPANLSEHKTNYRNRVVSRANGQATERENEVV